MALLATVSMMAGLGTIAVVAAAPSAGASSGTYCSKLSGNAAGTVTFKKCTFVTGKDKTNKTLVGNGTSLAAGGSLTWEPSGQTTVVGAPSFTAEGQASCKKNNTEYVVNGSVVGGSSTHTHSGDTFSTTVCLNNKNNKIALLKGTVAHF
jgi:hypothetical protein